MAFTQSASIEVKRIKGKGRGVFARRLIHKGELIEKVPMLVLSVDEYHDGIGKTSLANYCFAWGQGTVALALGYGSLYNHSYTPNADYEHGDKVLVYRALCDIEAGEEITVNYNGRPSDRSPVGFEVV